MTSFLLMLALLALVAVLIFGLLLIADDCSQEQVHRAQVRTEVDIDTDYEAARRAMNDAAGQSWRNLAE
ncbi:hypothetical protein [Rathayibacter sp. AY1A3]|uniref:hypothetical protein n=1 Tax=Rathayibacter sp. AY1A3 TaxID=2080521 RepID=UPI000CE8B9E1|nr:hypothetical protein [Rathayibacter sp. AY1A3]PPF38745.1 hypothetical protein C5C10_03510 [Rathayibacter sp. AY1A3]